MFQIDIKGDVLDNETGEMYDFFGEQYVSPSKVQSALDEADNQDVELDISSYGGDLFAASEIYTMLNQYPGKVTGVIQGMAASAASVIAEACDHLIISPAAEMMIHKVSTADQGNSDEFLHTADVLSTADRTLVGIYEAKTGKSESEILNLMKNETYLTAQDAVDQGFADEVMKVGDKTPQVVNALHTIPSKDAVKKFMNLIKMQKSVDAGLKNKSDASTLFDRKLAILRGKNNGN